MSFLTKTLKDALAKVNAMPVWKKTPKEVAEPHLDGLTIEDWREEALCFQQWMCDAQDEVTRLRSELRAVREWVAIMEGKREC